MTQESHQLARDFFLAIARGELPDSLVTEGMTAWTLTSGDYDRAKFAGGVKMLSAVFNGTLVYDIETLTAEEGRVLAEVKSRGTLINGDDFANVHVFAFDVTDGKISAVREYMNPIIVAEKIAPLMGKMIDAAAK